MGYRSVDQKQWPKGMANRFSYHFGFVSVNVAAGVHMAKQRNTLGSRNQNATQCYGVRASGGAGAR